jgi:hypothetical protein
MSRSRLRIPEPYRPAAKIARALGWSIVMTGRGRLKWTAPDGTVVLTAATPSSGSREDRAKLRRAGLKEAA